MSFILVLKIFFSKKKSGIVETQRIDYHKVIRCFEVPQTLINTSPVGSWVDINILYDHSEGELI